MVVEVVKVTTETLRWAKLQWNHHRHRQYAIIEVSIYHMSLLPPSQQCQSTEFIPSKTIDEWIILVTRTPIARTVTSKEWEAGINRPVWNEVNSLIIQFAFWTYVWGSGFRGWREAWQPSLKVTRSV